MVGAVRIRFGRKRRDKSFGGCKGLFGELRQEGSEGCTGRGGGAGQPGISIQGGLDTVNAEPFVAIRHQGAESCFHLSSRTEQAGWTVDVSFHRSKPTRQAYGASAHNSKHTMVSVQWQVYDAGVQGQAYGSKPLR